MEPEAKKLRLEDEIPKKKTEWFDLPYDVRYIIIEKMDRRTKLCYLLCSDDCAADMPKNLFKKINYSRTCLTAYFNDKSRSRYTFHFENTGRSVAISSRKGRTGENWRCEESKSLSEVIAKYFQRVIRKSLNLKELSIEGDFPFEITSIKHLMKLKRLLISPYKHIDLLESGFIDAEQLYNINSINISLVPLTIFQLTQMKAERIKFSSNDLSGEYINQYLKLFVDGQLQKNLRSVKFNLLNYNEAWITDTVENGLEIINRFREEQEEEDEEADSDDAVGGSFDNDIRSRLDENECSFAVISKEDEKRVAVVRYRFLYNSFRIRFWSRNNLYNVDAPNYRADFFKDNYHFKIEHLLR